MKARVASHAIETGVLRSSAESMPSMDGSSVSEGSVEEVDPYSEEKELSKSRPFNQRVLLPSGEEWDNQLDEVGDAGAGGNDGDEEELTRHRVKLASDQIVRSVEKKDKKKKRSAAKAQ
jgi:hypothetical protein